MPVKFQPFAQAGAGSSGFFSDTFNRANVNEGAGPNWAVNRQQSVVNVSLFDLNTNSLRFQSQAGTVAVCLNFMWPLPGGAMFQGTQAGATALQAVNHFSQATWLADNSVGGSLTRVGPAVACTGLVSTVNSCYWIENLPELLSFNLDRMVNGAVTVLVDHSATPQYATVVGLTIKISVEFTSAATTTVRTYVNGTLVDTFLDTNAARLTNGAPVMVGQFASTGPTRFATFSRYDCGPGI